MLILPLLLQAITILDMAHLIMACAACGGVPDTALCEVLSQMLNPPPPLPPAAAGNQAQTGGAVGLPSVGCALDN